MMKFVLLASTALAAFSASSATAASISLSLVASYARSGPFGLAFDGTNLWWSQSSAQINQMTLAGVDTGVGFVGPVWSELAWNGAQLMAARDTTVYFFDRDGGNQTTATITEPSYGGISLNDGLDWDSGELWSSPDVGNVYRLTGDLTAAVGPTPFLGGGGGYSGVERIKATDGSDYVVVVNDANNPRELCVHMLDASLVGCQQFQNARYEGLAFDGRYVWAADFFGNKIDQYDILGDGGGSIIDPEPNVIPLPAALPMAVAAFGALALAARRRRV